MSFIAAPFDPKQLRDVLGTYSRFATTHGT